MKFTLLTRGVSDYLTTRYSERKQVLEKDRISVDLNSM